MTTKPVRLLPCPFCGSPAEYQGWHGGAPTKVMVSCSDETCAVGPEVTGETLAEGADKWNARSDAPAISELLEALRSAAAGLAICRNDAREEGTKAAIHRWYREAKAAIDKAEGRS